MSDTFKVSTVVDGELEVAIYDHDPESEDVKDLGKREYAGDRVRIHPWDRSVYGYPGARSREVYIEVANVDRENRIIESDSGIEDEHHNAIVDRDVFVNAILAVFPELQMRESNA